MADIRKNKAKEKLARGEVVTALAGVDNADWVDFLGPTGIDAIWIEAEHGRFDFSHLSDMTRACDLWGMTSIVRVGYTQPNLIYRTLDRGSQGIVVPHVNSRQEAELVVDSAKYAPIGHRGMYSTRQGHGVPDYLTRANDETLIVILIEDIAAVRQLDEILSVDHIDVFHVAPSDLAQSMGHLGAEDHPEVLKTVDESIDRIVRSGRTAGTTATFDGVARYIEAGARFFYHDISDWIESGASRYMAAVAAAQD